MNFALANARTTASTSSLHTTTHGCFVAHLVRRFHFDQCSVETTTPMRTPLASRRQLQDTTRNRTPSRCTVDQAQRHPQTICAPPTSVQALPATSENSRKVLFTRTASTQEGNNHPQAAPTPETTFSEHNFLTPKLFLRSLGTFRWPPPWIPRTLHGAMQLQTELTRVLDTACTHQHIQHKFASCWSGPIPTSGTPSPLLRSHIARSMARANETDQNPQPQQSQGNCQGSANHHLINGQR